MSATADADLFADYFQKPSKRANENAIKAVETSKITIPGFTPVKEYYLEGVFQETRFLVGQKSKYAKTAVEKKRQLALLENEEDIVDPNALLSSSDDEDYDDNRQADREVPSWGGGRAGRNCKLLPRNKKKNKNDEDNEDDEDDTSDDDDDDDDDDDAEDWALNKNQVAKKRASIPKLSPATNNIDNNETTADENMKRRKEEEERERQTELALARKHLEENYSDDVKRSFKTWTNPF